jgi:SAM-dependent methyltransferase
MSMREFWDERAREDALFFVDDRVPYGQADVEAFFAGGEEAVGIFEADLEFRAAGDHLVDIGCGVGRLTRVLAARAAEVTAIDVSAEMLAQAKEHNAHLDNVRWVHGDGTSLAGIDDNWADGVFSHVVFQHIPDPQITLGYVREMGRVLRPDGWAAFQISNDPAVHTPRRGTLRTRLRGWLRRGPRGRTNPAWVGSAVDLAELRTTADEAGLDVVRVAHERTQYCLVRLRKR